MIDRKDILINVGDGKTVHLLFKRNLAVSTLWNCSMAEETISDLGAIFAPHKKRYQDPTDMLVNVHQSEIEKDRAATIKRLRELGEEKARFAADVLQNEWFDFGIEKKPPTLNSVTKDDLVICSSHVYGVYIGNKYNIPRNRIYSSHDRLHGLMPKRVFVVNEHDIDGSLLQAVKSRFTGRSEVIYITEE